MSNNPNEVVDIILALISEEMVKRERKDGPVTWFELIHIISIVKVKLQMGIKPEQYE